MTSDGLKIVPRAGSQDKFTLWSLWERDSRCPASDHLKSLSTRAPTSGFSFIYIAVSFVGWVINDDPRVLKGLQVSQHMPLLSPPLQFVRAWVLPLKRKTQEPKDVGCWSLDPLTLPRNDQLFWKSSRRGNKACTSTTFLLLLRHHTRHLRLTYANLPAELTKQLIKKSLSTADFFYELALHNHRQMYLCVPCFMLNRVSL